MRLYRVLACAVALLGFGLGTTRVSARTYPFEATYNVETTAIPIPSYVNVFQSTDTGESTNAPYGLTTVFNSNYATSNPDGSVFTFGPDPATFGLKGFPIGILTISGQGSDKLFGTISGSAEIDFANGVGSGSSTVTITGVEGRFNGATGIFSLLENDTLSPDPTAPIKATWLVKGCFQVHDGAFREAKKKATAKRSASAQDEDNRESRDCKERHLDANIHTPSKTHQWSLYSDVTLHKADSPSVWSSGSQNLATTSVLFRL